MISYPTDFPAAARAEIERALADAEKRFHAAVPRPGPRFRDVEPGGISYVGMKEESDPAVHRYVLEVVASIVHVSCGVARERQWPADQLRQTTHGLIDQLIARAYREKHSKGELRPVTLEDFTTTVHRELRGLPALQDAIRTLPLAPPSSVPTRTPAAPSLPAASAAASMNARGRAPFPRRAEWLRDKMHARKSPLTGTQIQVRGGPSHHTITRILTGLPVRSESLEKLASVLSELLKDPVTVTDIPSD